MKYDHVDGITLDVDYERTFKWDLPLVTKTSSLSYDTDEYGVENQRWTDTFGEVMFMADLHVGSEGFSNSVFNLHIDFLRKRPHVQIGLLGDYIENAAKTHYINDEIMKVDDQIDLCVAHLKPFKDRIMFMLWGNHEERDAKATGSNKLVPYIASELGLKEEAHVAKPQRGVNGILSAGDINYGLYAYHGTSNSTVNKFSQLDKEARKTNASVIVQGHNHYLGSKRVNTRDLNADGRTTKSKLLVCAGCFMKDASYAEAKSYPLNVIGSAIVRFNANYGRTDFTDLSAYRFYHLQGGQSVPLGEGIVDRAMLDQIRGTTVHEPVAPTRTLLPYSVDAKIKKRGSVLL